MTLEVITEHNGDIGQNASNVNSFHCTQVVESTEKGVSVVCIRWLQDMPEVSSVWTSLDAGFQPSGSCSGPAAVGVGVSRSTAIICSWCWGQLQHGNHLQLVLGSAATWRLISCSWCWWPGCSIESAAVGVGVSCSWCWGPLRLQH